MKTYTFVVGYIANDVETSEDRIEAKSYVAALEQVIADADLYIKPVGEEAKQHVTRVLSVK